MEFYLVLSLATIVITGLTVLMWQKTRTFAFPLGIAFMYFWTLYGGWRIVRSLDGSSDETPYLFYKLVPVFLNSDYMMALLLYSLFIVAVQVTVLCVAIPKERIRSSQPIEISHWRVVAMAGTAGVLGYLLIRNSLAEGADNNVSSYAAVRDASLFTFYEVLNRAAMTLVSVGLAVSVSGREPRYFAGRGNRLMVVPYFAIFCGLIYLCMKTGNRTEAALAFALLVLFYSANAQRPRRALMIAAGAAGAIVITLVKLLRDGVLSAANHASLLDIWSIARDEVLRSTESIAAHLSMYGVVHKQLPLTWGSSFASLLFSFVPRAVWPNRPGTVYDDYVTGMAAVEGQGYTIHHATGWYMNFGIAGVILGAVLIGLIWSGLFNLLYRRAEPKTGLGQIFATIGFWTFTSAIPVILRAGPEVYKTIGLDSFLIPTLLIGISSTSLVKRYNRPSLALVRHLQTDASRRPLAAMQMSGQTPSATRGGQ
ncbi:MAG TPA: hypothetical protein VMM16_10605 [Verrucomicrobiae bacterium]|nr:hypothetical protein [Verrucomicrobiae bacterium]